MPRTLARQPHALRSHCFGVRRFPASQLPLSLNARPAAAQAPAAHRRPRWGATSFASTRSVGARVESRVGSRSVRDDARRQEGHPSQERGGGSLRLSCAGRIYSRRARPDRVPCAKFYGPRHDELGVCHCFANISSMKLSGNFARACSEGTAGSPNCSISMLRASNSRKAASACWASSLSSWMRCAAV